MEEHMKDIILKVIDLVKSYTGKQVDEKFNIKKELDSLEIVSFLLNIEDEFNVEIDIEGMDMSTLESIESFADFLSKDEFISFNK